ncbi:MAG TPA: serine hydrolase domain-containing protein [Anaerolineaceae bacterium]
MRKFQEAFQQLDECLAGRMKEFHTPALVMALTDRSRSLHVTALGFAQLETQTPVRPDHLFPIGSVGKSFTAIATLQASEAGLLNLRAPVKEYLPWFEVQSSFEPITIHHLLTHSSGLPRGTDFSPDPRSEVYAVRRLETSYAPGKHIFYSDLGYKILGLVLEAATGKPYAELITEKILHPLGMENTFAVTTSSLRPRMAAGYRTLYDDRPRHTCHPLVPAAWVETNSSDGCIISTVEDMARFARMLLNEGLGPTEPLMTEASYKKLVTPMIEDEGEVYSYGLYLFEDEGYQIAGHGGDVPGYSTYLWLDLDNGLGSVALMTEPYTPRASFMALETLRAAYLGHRLPEPPPLPDFTHVKDAAQFAGTYHTAGCELVFAAENHHLVLVADGERVVLEERGLDSFYTCHPSWDRYLFRFGRSNEGQVVEVCYGPQWFTNEQYQGPVKFDFPAEWLGYTGHFRSHNPWNTNFRVFVRKGQLIYSSASGEEELLVPLGEGRFRIGEESYLPERLAFDQVVEGQALRAIQSGCPYYRFFTP